MPHKCMKCEKEYSSGSLELKKGCSCGAKVFLFFNSENEGEKQKALEFFESDDRIKKIEEGLANLIEESNTPVSLEVENIRIVEKGVFEINLGALIQNPLLIVRGTDGVYYVKLPKGKASEERT